MKAPTQKLKIFVYGSLRTGFFNYNKYLKGHVIERKIGKVNGRLFHMKNKGYPALIEGDDEVYGEVMTIDNYVDVVKAMDEMEGYKGMNNAENEYNRLILDVKLIDENKAEKCYVYMYNQKDSSEFIENREYLEHGDWTKNRDCGKIN
ncbi:MAG: gamma-glutamylcyclotransferase family protein [Clostridium sp.]